MLDAICFVGIAIIAFRAFIALQHQSAIFQEFSVPRGLAVLTAAYPMAPLAMLVSRFAGGRVAVLALAVLLFISGIVVASHTTGRLERAGTDRVKPALAAASMSSSAAILGVVYVSVVALFLGITAFYSAHTGRLGV